jgi:hypothetical protein
MSNVDPQRRSQMAGPNEKEMLNGLTEAETAATASVAGLSRDEPVDVDARKLAWELAGVLEDVSRSGFDEVCLRTIQRVHAALVAQEVHPAQTPPRQLHEWAALQDESDGSPWSEGYEAARRYVAMQLSQQPNGGAPAAPCEFCEANKKLADIALRAAERQQRMGHLAELHGSAPAALEADERSLLLGMRSLIADDAHAMTFQTFGQYRTNLLHCVDLALKLSTGVPQDSEPTRSDE